MVLMFWPLDPGSGTRLDSKSCQEKVSAEFQSGGQRKIISFCLSRKEMETSLFWVSGESKTV